MVRSSSLEKLKFVDDGSTDWDRIINNFDTLQEDIKENAADLKALARHQTWTVTQMFETQGVHNLMNAGKHLRCKVLSAYAQLGDSSQRGVIVELVGLGQKIEFKETENAGKVKGFTIHPNRVIHFSSPCQVTTTGNRRIIVSATFESVEEAE